MSCSCNHNKCGLLGDLEQKIMNVLWSARTPRNPRSVLNELKGEPYAYTTIMTVLKRMADKKIVNRVFSGKSFLYSPLTNREDYACNCLDELISRLYSSYGKLFINRFEFFKKNLTP